MKRKPSAKIPVALSTACDRFEQWRRQHPNPRRLPPELWDQAVALARQHGLSKTAGPLRLNYDALKRRVQAKTANLPPAPSAPGAFVELRPGPLPAVPLHCTIELDEGQGAVLRLHVQGATMADLAAFVARLRGGRS
jgi:hypothetical protein